MSGMRVDILERELSKLKKKDPERFKKIINRLLEIEEDRIPRKEAIKAEPTYSVFQHPDIEKSLISDIPDNPAFIEQAYYAAISKLSTQNEKAFFNSKVKLSKEKDETILQVSEDVYNIIKKLYYIDEIDNDIIEVDFRLQRDQGTILSPAPYVKAKKIAIDLIENEKSKFRHLFEAINTPLVKSEYSKESKKLLISLIKKNIKKYKKAEIITIITLNIRNISNRYYESIERRDIKINPEDLLFTFPLFEGFKYLRENKLLFSPIEGKYKMNILFEWSSSHQVTFTIWMISFLIAIKIYDLAEGGKKL